jgi:putative ABC transport system permease protein
MNRLALRGMASRKLRAILTALAIVFGTAMVCATLVLTSTATRGFESWFTEADRGADVVVSGKPEVRSADRDTSAPAVPASLVGAIRQVPGAATVGGAVEGTANLIGRDGKTLGVEGPPKIGISVPRHGLTGVRLVSGRWPHAGEVAVDRFTASDGHFRIGDAIGVATSHPTKRYRIAGLVQLADVGTAGATIAVFDTETAQAILDRPNQVDTIRVRAEEGVSPAELVRRINAADLASPVALRVETAHDHVERTMHEQLGFIDIFRYVLLAFGGVALLVGSFIIYNTFAITVAQRVRELALLRCLGATRRQALVSVLAEGLAIGTVASLIGTGAGIALGAGLIALFNAVGMTIPEVPIALTPGTLLPSLIVGIGITLVAALVPAARAGRVAPAVSLRDAVASRNKPRGRSLIAGLASLLLAGAALSLGTLGDPGSVGARLLLIAVGTIGLFGSIAALASRLVPVLVTVLAWPMRRISGVPGALAAENASRLPGRTAATAAALMIGVALASFMAIFANVMAGSQSRQLDKSVRADYVVQNTEYFGAFDKAIARRIAAVPGVAAVAEEADEISLAGKGAHIAIGVDPATFGHAYNLDWQQGSNAVLANLGAKDAVMEQTIARSEGLQVGDRFPVTTPTGRKTTLTLRGTYKDNAFAAGFLMPLSSWRTLFATSTDTSLYVVREPGTSVETVEAAIRSSISGWAGMSVKSHADLRAEYEADAQDVTSMFYAMLALSVIISIFGVVNTLALSVLERTREIGLLRAVGGSRRQVRRMVRYEGVLTTLIGATLGLALGVFLAGLTTASIDGATFSVPTGQLAAMAIIAGVLGVLAAVAPARRATRLDVVDALAFE